MVQPLEVTIHSVVIDKIFFYIYVFLYGQRIVLFFGVCFLCEM